MAQTEHKQTTHAGAHGDHAASHEEIAATQSTTFTAAGQLPPVGAGETTPPPTASQLAYGLTDEEIRAFLTTAKTEAQIVAFVRKHPSDRERILALVLQTWDQQAVDAVKAALDSNPRQDELTAEHGVRPRKYPGALDGSNLAEVQLRQIMPEIAAWMNQKAKALRLDIQFTVAELTTNFLAEGGILALNTNLTEGLDGFQYAGVDTFMDRYQELTPWLHPSITKDNVGSASYKNEKGETVRSINNLTLIQAAYANAAMYAAGKARLERYLKRQGTEVESLTPEQQFYWGTMYYNAGEGVAQKNLAAGGVRAADKKWPKADDWSTYHRSATYNAKMRLSTFEYTRDVAMENDQFKPIDPAQQAAVTPEVDMQISSLEVRCAGHRDEIAMIDKLIADGATGSELQQLQQERASHQSRLVQAQQQLEALRKARTEQLGAVPPQSQQQP